MFWTLLQIYLESRGMTRTSATVAIFIIISGLIGISYLVLSTVAVRGN